MKLFEKKLMKGTLVTDKCYNSVTEELLMENNNNIPETISYYDHQEQMWREERHTRRWRTFAWVLLAALILTNLGWIIYESTYQDVVVTDNVQDGSGMNIIGGGDVNYEPEAKDD